MPVDGKALSDLIGGIYACALEPGRWVDTLERLAEAFGARSSALYDRGGGGIAFHCEWGSAPGSHQAFAERHMLQSPLLTMGWHFEIDQPITLASFMQPEELRRTRFYREWLRPQGWFDFVGAILAKSAERISVVMFLRPEGAPAPGERETRLLRLLAPHLRRALEIQGALQAATAGRDNLAALLDVLPLPVLLFDGDGGCIEANAAAERFLAGSAVVRLAGGRLRAVPGDGLGAVLAPAGGQPDSVALAEPDGRRFVAHVLPLADGLQARRAGSARARTAVFIQAVGDVQPLPGEVLVKLYGLTPAETRMLGLIGQGLTVAEAAESLGISMPTARTHMRSLFGKTGARRQAELVRLTLGALPRPAAPGERPG